MKTSFLSKDPYLLLLIFVIFYVFMGGYFKSYDVIDSFFSLSLAQFILGFCMLFLLVMGYGSGANTLPYLNSYQHSKEEAIFKNSGLNSVIRFMYLLVGSGFLFLEKEYFSVEIDRYNNQFLNQFGEFIGILFFGGLLVHFIYHYIHNMRDYIHIKNNNSITWYDNDKFDKFTVDLNKINTIKYEYEESSSKKDYDIKDLNIKKIFLGTKEKEYTINLEDMSLIIFGKHIKDLIDKCLNKNEDDRT
jgi:hypothetical protein